MTAQRRPTFPLGLDVGRTRVRVALSERSDAGRATLIAVATRDVTGEDAAPAIRDAVDELATRERRCVIGIGHPDALLRAVTLPPMSPWERARATTFQAARYIDYPPARAALSLRPLDGKGRWVLGIARRVTLQARVAAARRAKLRPVAVDDVAFALARANADADGTIDVAADTTRLTIFARPIPSVAGVPIGASHLTEAIAQSLGIDTARAEERKRAIGFGGAGETRRDALIDGLASLLATARATSRTEIHRLVMVGSGSRVPGLAEAIERATGYAVRPATLDADVSDRVPPDVLRAAAPDWSLAYGLSTWMTAS